MIGILTNNQVFIAQTSKPFILEHISEYKYTDSLIPKNYLSISDKFRLNPKNNSEIEDFFPIYPNEIIINKYLEGSDRIISYVQRSSLTDQFLNGDHVFSKVNKITSQYESFDVNNTFLVLIENYVVVFIRLKHEIVFFHIYKCSSAEEILYFVNQLYRDRNLDFEKDILILLGQANQKMGVFQLFANYFRKVFSDDSNPLSNTDELTT
ncbi:MAG: DUF3822 family protein [Saprospiraceae bacterium]